MRYKQCLLGIAWVWVSLAQAEMTVADNPFSGSRLQKPTESHASVPAKKVIPVQEGVLCGWMEQKETLWICVDHQWMSKSEFEIQLEKKIKRVNAFSLVLETEEELSLDQKIHAWKKRKG